MSSARRATRSATLHPARATLLRDAPDPREMLARLSARAVPLEVADKSPPRFLGAELAGLLAKLPRHAQLLALWKYAGNRSVIPDLVRMVEAYWRGVAIDEGWRLSHDGNLLREMVRLALHEVVDEPVCGCCKGRREVVRSGKVVACPGCEGSGMKQYRDADYAKLLGMSRQSWAQSWAGRYERIWRGVAERAARAEDALLDKLRRELRG